MPNKITYTIKTADGKEHQVSKENIDKHGIQAYADAYEGATIRMRDSKKGDYDIPLANYNDAKAQGLHAFSWEHKPVVAQNNPQATQKQPTPKVNTTQGTPMTAAQKAQVLNNANNIIAQSQSDLSRTMRKFDYAKQNTGLDVKPIKLGENRKIIKQSSFNPQTGKKEESYLTESGNIHDSYANASTEQNAIDDFKEQEKHSKIENQLNAAYKERDSITKALQRRMAELDKQGGHGLLRQFADAMSPDLAMHSSPRDYEMDEEYGALMSAARKNNSTIQILEDKKKGRMNNFWSTLGATFSNGYTFTDGLSGVRDNIAILNANKRADKINRKRQRGEMLTNEEDAFDKALLANLVNEEIEGTYGQEYGALARAAKITASTADVVKDFLLSGGTGITLTKGVAKGVMNAGAKYLTKKAGESLLKASAKAFGRGLLKATGIGVGSLAGGALITNTTGIGKTAEEMSKQVTGRVGVDQHGNYIFTDSKDLMHAFIEAERSMIGENASEMLGEFIPGSKVLKKGLEKIGLSKISSYLTSIGNKSWAKNYGKLLEAAGWNGLPGEGLEEYAGIAYNSLTGDSEGGIATLGDARTHIDIWLGCAAAGALLGAPNVVALGANTAQYYRYKHATNKAAQQAKSQLTADRWNALQERIDNTENQDLTNLMLEVYTNKELSPKQKKAVFNYTDNLVRMRGYNIGSINNADATRDEKGEKELHKEENIGNAYATGYHATEDELANIKNKLELRHRQLAETFKDDPSALQQIEEDPKAFLQGLKESEVGGEKAKVINAYEETRAAYDGMIQRVKDNIDDAITENNTVIEQRTHQDGNIYSATMKLDDRKVYVVGGNVQMNEDGKGIDHEKSSSSVMIRDAETGKVEMVDPSAILSIDTPVNAEEEKATSSEQIRQTYAQEQANKIDGVLEFKAGDTYSILDEDQKQHTIQIIGEAIDEKTKQPNPDMVMASIDGLEPTMLPKEQIQAMNDEENLWRLDQSLKQGEEVENTTPHSAQSYNLNDEITLINEDGKPVRGSITTDQNEDGKFEVYTEEPINGKRVNLFTAEELDAMTGKQQEQTNQAPVQGEQGESPALVAENATTQKEDVAGLNDGTIAENATVQKEETPQHEPTALESIPTNEQGEPIYEQADPETAWDAILEQTEGDESIAQSVADGMVADMEVAVKRAEKAKVKGGTTIAEKIAAEKERVATIEQAKARLEHWKKIASTNSRRQEAIQAEESRKAKEAALLRKEQEEKERAMREEAQPQTLDYKLSDEVDENGHPFVLTSAGEVAFGKIGKETGLAPAPILLSEGVITNSKTNAGYGLVHIEARHGEQIRNAGYPSVIAFVEEVAKHYDVIREGINRSGEQTYMLQLTDRHNNTLMVELSGDGTYYNINTAGIFKTSYGKNRREVYNRHATDNQSTESGEESQGEAQSGTTSPSRMKSSTRSSAGKVSESSNAVQGNAEKTSENEDLFAKAERIASAEQAKRTRKNEETKDRLEDKNNIENRESGKRNLYAHNVDMQGNLLDENGKLKLEKVNSIDDITDDDFNNPTRNIELPVIPQRINDAIGANGKRVIIKKNIFEKNKKRHRDLTPTQSRDIIKEALYNATLYGQNQKETRPYNWILIHNKDKNSSILIEVNNSKNNVEVINWHYLNDNSLERKKRQAIREGGRILTLESAVANTSEDLSSTGKVSESSNAVQENAEKTSENEATRVETNPTEAQKEAGNYKKGHIKVDGMNITIEQPKGSIRRGKDASGKEWESEMHNTYGYIRGTEGVDGDHIDIFLSDNPNEGSVFVVDQVNKDGSFDEHKVMYGFADKESARKAYLSNYEDGWQGLGNITEVSKEEFKKWIGSSKRKTKPFAEYSSVKTEGVEEAKSEDEIVSTEKVRKAINAYEEAQEKFDNLFSLLVKEKESDPFDNREWREVNRTKEELKDVLLQLNTKELGELLKQVSGKNTEYVIKNVLDIVNREEHRLIAFNAILDKQSNITPEYKEGEKAIPVSEFVETDEKRAETHTMLTGVFHDKGYVVGTDAHLLLARKEDYDKSLEGKVTNKKGEVINGKYPNWRAVVNSRKQGKSWGVNLEELHAFTRGVLTKLKTEKVNPSTKKDAKIAFKTADGKIVLCYANALDKALQGAKSIGAKSFFSNDDVFAITQTPKGYVICPMLNQEQNIDDNSFAYVPRVSGLQHSTETTNSSNVVHSFGNSASQNDTSIKLSDTSFASEEEAERAIQKYVEIKEKENSTSEKLTGLIERIREEYKDDPNVENIVREKARALGDEVLGLVKERDDFLNSLDKSSSDYVTQVGNNRLVEKGVLPINFSSLFQNRKNEVAQNAVVQLLKRIGIPVHLISRVGAEVSGQGNSRGWTNGLDIWLTKDNINAETPVHEYTHIWTFALMKKNPKLWAEIKNLLKDSEWVDAIQSMDEYKYTLDNEDLLYSEVLSRISGERNGEKFESMAFKLIKEVNSVEKKVDLKRGLEKLRDALKRFWEWVGVNLFGMKEFKSVDDVCDRVLFDLLNASDIARTEEMREYYEEEREMNTIIDKAKEDGTYLKTPSGEDSKLPEKVWAYARTKKFKTQLSDRLNLILNESKEDFKDWEKEEFRDLFKKHDLLEENNEPGRFLVSQFMYSEKYYDRKGKMQEEAKETMNSGKGGENVSSVKSVDITEEAKTFAEEHNLNIADVIAYKQAMEEGLLRDANKALSDIRRKLREENKELSLSGFVKKFSPIREALYKQFGDLGVLEKEYHDSILKERGLMEAARKREEEERKRQNEPIEELMSMTSEERDAEYMRALEAKDEKRMSEVLQAEAKLKGYSMGAEYQGEGAWKAPSNPGYSSTEERRAALEKDSPHLNIDDIANGYMNLPEDIFTDLRAYGNDNESGRESAKAISDAISDIKDGKGMPEVTVYRAVPTSVEEESLRNGDWVTPSKAYAKEHGEHRLDGDYRIIEQKVPANELWWDGNDIREWGFDNGKDYAYKNTENSRKLNDLITRDDQGNVILPSQRFNDRVEDERFRNDEELEKVNQRFNEELKRYKNGEMNKNEMLHLGSPHGVMRSFLPDLPIVMRPRILNKASSTKHNVDISVLENLPFQVSHPIFVFKRKDNALGVLTEIKDRDGLNVCVAIELNKIIQNGGELLEVNDIRSIHGRSVSNLILPIIHNNTLKYVDKAKALNYLSSASYNYQQEIDNKELSSAANIVKSFENPTNSSEKVLDRKTAQAEEVAEKERQQMAERANELAETLHLDNVEIVTDANTLEGKKAKAKGFYSTSTGKITIVIPNHSNIADVEKTLLHEAVAHHGLRKLFGEHFDNFLDNVFKNASEDVRREIVKLAAKNKWDFRIATEEYLASLAEDTNFEKMPNGLWDKVKRLFLDMLRSIGLLKQKDGELNDNELRYILWRSYKNLKEKGQSNSILNKAEDIAMQHRLKVGNYSESTDKDVRFRDGEPQSKERVSAAERYEQRVSRSMFQTQEALQDSMLGLKEAMDAIMKAEGKEMYIEDIEGFENAYLGENRLSSVNQAETEAFAHLVFKPMLDEVAKLAKNDEERSELTDYMMAKHGLERNEVMRKNALEEIINNEKLSDAQKDARASIAEHRDYAGLTALTGASSVEEAESEAQRMVEEYEQKHDTSNLWDKVNIVTKGILSKSYECGMMNKQTYEKVRDMYKFYIPLRGFDEETSRDAYAYLSHGQSAFNAPIKTAKGRSSKADDPFANMQSMAESAIMQGNRNVLVKQKFLNFALNHPSDLVSVNTLWLKYDDVSEEWRPVFPDNIEETDTADEVEKKIQDFEQRMTDLAKQDPERYKHGKDTENIPYRIVESRDLRQHQVVVKRNGRDYVLTINGNPRAAQALNGLTNPDNDVSGAIGAILNFGEKINRQLSAFYTTRNPDFVVSNFIRDMLYANSIVWVKERPNYALRFHRNIGRCNPAQMKILLSKHKKGKLDMNNSLEHMFHQFIMNGGETGYANVRDIEQHKNDIQRELKRANGKIGIKRSLSLLGEKLDEYNRAVENCARFAAFLTSREMGRTIDRSIYDAKDISVNFNKKGSGAKFMNAVGQTKAGKTAAFVSGFGRSFYLFWNAAIQGTTNFGKQFKRHPAKAFTASATMFILGALVAGMGMGEGDDDDKNSYWNLPESVRRSNILFRTGDQWISIPLPVEYRSIYGMGELMISAMSGKEHFTDAELGKAIAGQVTQILPIDFLEGEGGVKAFVPSAVKPFAEVISNKGWTGMPIYKDTPYNKNMPEWTKTYKSANKYLIGLAKILNEKTGGDAYTKGAIDINPAQIEYLLNGYFGGVSNTIDKLTKSAETIAGKRDYDPKSFLLLNRVLKSGDERTEERAINREYYRLKEEYEILRDRLKNYENDTDNGVFDYSEKINFLYNSPEYARYEIFEDYRGDIESLYKELKEPMSDEERASLEAELTGLKKQMIEEMNSTRK